jgi:DNA-binding transcriptional LysR family regulator
VRLALIEAHAGDHLSLLERGDAHLAINVINVVDVDDHRFGYYLLPRFHVIAAGAPSLDLGAADTIEIRRLVDHPLLMLDTSYATRNLFDAACRMAGVRPNITLESVSSHTLLALAEAGHGVAVIPSILRVGAQGRLRTLRVAHRSEVLEIAPAVIWDKRRTLPRYANGFSELLAEHLHITFPTTIPAHKAGKPRRPPPARRSRAISSSPPASRRSRERAR